MRGTAVLIGLSVAMLNGQQTNAVPQGMTYPTLAEANKGLPKWLSFGGEYRARLEGFSGGGFRSGNSDAYLLNRVRLNMKLAPASWMKFTFQAQDARVLGRNAGAVPPYKDSIDLRMAYVELGDVEKKTFAAKVGRQELVFGEQRLVGHVSWLNTARTFDAVMGSFHHGNIRVDAFAASVVNIRDGEFNRHRDGDNFHGIYGKIDKIVPKGLLEPYVFWRLAPGVRGELSTTLGKTSFFTPGFRFVGLLPRGFDYSVEMALQSGTRAADDVGAWAGHWRLGYTLASAKWKPRLIGEYQYATGDKDPRDGRKGTFDQLYPTPHDKIGLADQVGWRNVSAMRLGMELKATKKLTLTPNYHNIWLASRRDALYSVAGVAVARSIDGTAGTHVGNEFDIQAVYALNKIVNLAGGYAYLWSGEFLKKTTPGKNYSFPYVQLNYTF